MPKKSTKSAAKAAPKTAVPPDSAVGKAAVEEKKPVATPPKWPAPKAIVDIATGRAINVSVIEGKTLPDGDGRLVHVESKPHHNWMTASDAANKFALRNSDGMGCYSEKGFATPLPSDYQPLDIFELVK